MGSHYIPVGKIKIDKEILDIVCPAAGYDTTPPPPEIYCPINGYILTPGTFQPPYLFEESPISGTDQILLIVENKPTNKIRFQLGTTVSNPADRYITTIEEFNGTVLDTYSVAVFSVYTEIDTWPSSSSPYLVIRIKQVTAEETFSYFRLYENSEYPIDLMPVIEARFYTPSMVDLINTFAFSQTIKKVSFFSPMDLLGRMNNTFSNSSLEYFQFQYDLPSLYQMSNTFGNSSIITVDFNNKKFQSLESTRQMFQNCANFQNFLNFNPGPAPVDDMDYMFDGTLLLGHRIDLSGLVITSGDVSTQYMFRYCATEEIEFFQHTGQQLRIKANNTITYCSRLLKVILNGDVYIYNSSFIATSNPKIKEIHYDTGASFESVISINTSLSTVEKIVLPTQRWGINFSDAPSATYNTGFNGGFSGIKEIINTPVLIGDIPWSVDMASAFIESFDFPTLKVVRIFLGAGISSALSSVDIDWANSFQHTWSSGTILINLRGQLTSQQINTIFTAIPTISVMARIDVRYTVGYSNCDKTIAQNKGWYVY